MDWIKALNALHGGDKLEDADGSSPTSKAYHKGMEEGEAFARRLMKLADPMAAKEEYFEASVMMFTAVCRAMGMLKVGVNKQRERDGDDNPVCQTFDLLFDALASGDAADGLAAVQRRRMEKGEDRE